MRHLPSRSRLLDLELLEARWVPAIAGAFQEIKLISDQAGVAPVTDTTLVNGWGIAIAPGANFWVSSAGGGVSEVYGGDVNGSAISQPFKVTIPGGSPTGQVFNGTNDFVVNNGSANGPALFIFASESGKVTGWNPNVPPPSPSTTAQSGFQAIDGAIYKGIALANNGTGNFLYLADFHNNKIDVLDAQYHKVTLGAGGFGTFTDPTLSAGFAPFNVALINGKLYVSYAKQDATATDDVPGAGNGFISVFDLNGHFLQRLVTQGNLNSPWGMVLAPNGFRDLGGKLLVGNFGDGHISAYDPTTGALIGTLNDASGQPLTIDGLWGLAFGNGTTAGDKLSLYFAAGPDDEAHGLFGKILASARGGDGAGGGVVTVSGQANGSVQKFTLGASGSLTPLGSPLTPFAGFTGTVRAATGDVNGDGVADTIVVTGPGTPLRYAVINGKDGTTLVAPTAAFSGSEDFAGGGFVSAGDIDGDGRAEWVITADQGGGPRVTVFSLAGTSPIIRSNFLGIDDVNFRGGARTALGDVNGDGKLDLAVA
ncbi:MAG TPA: TIGR03118 family protein, partial [Gemmataceae bacterium]|nr:TIGR03118 family protein [Gemmataceae bacterium]